MFKLIIAGNVSSDAQVRHTPNGHTVANFSVAVNHGTKEKPQTTFIECALWGKRAEGSLPEYIKKGVAVTIEGEPSTRAYMPKEGGEPRSVMVLNVGEIKLHSSSKGAQEGGGQQQRQPAQQQRQPAQQQASQPAPAGGVDDDDIPW